MKRSTRVLPWLAVTAAVLAYYLREAIHEAVVVPLAFLWWKVQLYARAIPDKDWLTLSAVFIFFVAYFSMTKPAQTLGAEESQTKHQPQGPVEELTTRLHQAPRLPYYRWLIAYQLARLAQAYLVQTVGRSVQRADGTFEAPGWDPPDEVESYLKYGLRRTSTAGKEARLHKSNPLGAVEYLESKIGERNDEN